MIARSCATNTAVDFATWFKFDSDLEVNVSEQSATFTVYKGMNPSTTNDPIYVSTFSDKG